MWRSTRLLATTGLLAALPLGQDPEPQDADITAGARIFQSNCALCHGRDATGGKGPNLAKGQFRYATSDAKFLDIIVNGIPGAGMGPAAWNRTSH